MTAPTPIYQFVKDSGSIVPQVVPSSRRSRRHAQSKLIAERSTPPANKSGPRQHTPQPKLPLLQQLEQHLHQQELQGQQLQEQWQRLRAQPVRQLHQHSYPPRFLQPDRDYYYEQDPPQLVSAPIQPQLPPVVQRTTTPEATRLVYAENVEYEVARLHAQLMKTSILDHHGPDSANEPPQHPSLTAQRIVTSAKDGATQPDLKYEPSRHSSLLLPSTAAIKSATKATAKLLRRQQRKRQQLYKRSYPWDGQDLPQPASAPLQTEQQHEQGHVRYPPGHPETFSLGSAVYGHEQGPPPPASVNEQPRQPRALPPQAEIRLPRPNYHSSVSYTAPDELNYTHVSPDYSRKATTSGSRLSVWSRDSPPAIHNRQPPHPPNCDCSQCRAKTPPHAALPSSITPWYMKYPHIRDYINLLDPPLDRFSYKLNQPHPLNQPTPPVPPTYMSTRFHTAVKNGHTDKVALLLEEGASIEAVDNDNNTPLHLAARNGYTDMVELLLVRGAQIEAVNENNDAPLRLATRNGHADTVELLLRKLASVETMDKDKVIDTPLHYAAWKGYTGIVKLLLGKGALIDSMHKANNTPIHYAALNGHSSTVNLLLENNASIGVINNDYHTPLHLAARNGRTDTVELLLRKGASVRAMDKVNNTPMHCAAWSGHSDTVEKLLVKGASIQAMNKYNNSPMHYAALNGHSGTVELLIRNGASLHDMNTNNQTPLYCAACNGCTSVVELLLVKGASIEAMDKNNSSPIHHAAWNGHFGTVELLLRKGALIEAMDKTNHTPLHYAAWKGHASIVELLLEKGASIEAVNENKNTPLHLAALHGHIDTTKLLLGQGAYIEAINKYSNTPLHLAAWSGHTGVVEVLIGEDAKVEAINRDNKTPMQMAAQSGHTDTVKLLTSKGTKPDVDGEKLSGKRKVKMERGRRVGEWFAGLGQ